MKQVFTECGDTHLPIEVPDDAIVVRAGETYQDPPALADPVAATREALAHPLGMPRLGELVRPDSKVVIAFPDRVKGGAHATAHRRIAIPLIVEELRAAGVPERNIKLVCAMGLHRKNLMEEWRWYLGSEIVDRFRGDRLVNHDAEDPDGIVHVGEDEFGDWVDVNRDVYEADLAILIGHAQGNPYGGFSGGYKMLATGLTTWRSIRHHHTPGTMHRPDFLPATTQSHFRQQLQAIGKTIEAGRRQKIFAIDAVLDSSSRQLAVFAGSIDKVEEATWPIGRQKTEVTLDTREKADIIVVGEPREFHYGPGMGSNPILMLQAIGSTVTRNYGAFKEGGVVIATAVCDGWFNDEWFPSYREVYNLLQRCADPAELTRYEDEVSNRPEYIYKYRHGYAYHPFHAFSMASMGAVALQHTKAVFIAGAREPGFARGMGCIPTRTFAEALEKAKKYVGSDPKIMVIPELSKQQVHLKVQS